MRALEALWQSSPRRQAFFLGSCNREIFQSLAVIGNRFAVNR